VGRLRPNPSFADAGPILPRPWAPLVRLAALPMIAFCLAALSGCETAGPEAVSAPIAAPPPAAEMQYEPEPGLTARERLRKAITLLEVGQAEQARAELQAYLQEVPNSKLAGGLIKQIDTDPTVLFGTASYPYTLLPGESLSIVAKRTLGDAMLFHALARYNGIANPSALKAGQTIRIPGQAPVAAPNTAAAPVPEATPAPIPAPAPAPTPVLEPSAAAEPAPEPTVGTAAAAPEPGASPQMESEADRLRGLMLTAHSLSQARDYQGAAALYEESVVEFPDDVNLKQLAAANYVNYASQLSDTGQPDKAVEALSRAAELVPDNPNLKQRLATARRQVEARSLYVEGLDLYAQRNLADAYGKFSEAASLNPELLGAREKIAEIAPLITARWHREALVRFQRQDLKTAVALWDKVLEVDPNHIQAQVYRAQAKELDDRLSSLRER